MSAVAAVTRRPGLDQPGEAAAGGQADDLRVVRRAEHQRRPGRAVGDADADRASAADQHRPGSAFAEPDFDAAVGGFGTGDADEAAEFAEQPVALIEERVRCLAAAAGTAELAVDLGEAVGDGVDLRRRHVAGGTHVGGKLRQAACGGAERRGGLVGAVEEDRACRGRRGIGGECCGGIEEARDALGQPRRAAAEHGLQPGQPVGARRQAVEVAVGVARRGGLQRVIGARHDSWCGTAAEADVALERIARSTGRSGMDRQLAPDIAGRVGVGDVVADHAERGAVGTDARCADAEQVGHRLISNRRAGLGAALLTAGVGVLAASSFATPSGATAASACARASS